MKIRLFAHLQLKQSVAPVYVDTVYIYYQRQVAQLSHRDRAAGWVSYRQKWKTGTAGRQYLWTL